MPRGIPNAKRAAAPAADHDDDDDGGKPKQTVRGIGQWPSVKPAAKAASSIFDAGDAAKPKRERIALDLASVPIEHGVPIPPRMPATSAGYRALLDRMKPGDCVTLPKQAAACLVSLARKLGRKAAIRKLDATTARVWTL